MEVEDNLAGCLVTQLGVQVSALCIAALALHLSTWSQILRGCLLPTDCHLPH